MTISDFFTNTVKVIKSNSPVILTALGVSGVVTTSYLTAKATYKVARDEDADPFASNKDKVKKYWKLYIPPAISGVMTVGCIIGASRSNTRRTAAAAAAYSITEKAFNEYKEKVAETIGKGKEQKIRDDIAQDHVTNNPPSNELIVLVSGHVLCREEHTGRYFRSDMETLLKAQNRINHMINNQLWVTLSEFYELLGLPHTSSSSEVGWNSERGLMELQFSTAIASDNEPCLTFEYNYIVLL
jgi:hypothetical protein